MLECDPDDHDDDAVAVPDGLVFCTDNRCPSEQPLGGWLAVCAPAAGVAAPVVAVPLLLGLPPPQPVVGNCPIYLAALTLRL
jgi:hypothetical protein